MDFVVILLWVCIGVVLFYIFSDLTKIFLSKPVILYMLSTFNKGNFVILDYQSNELVKVINEPDKYVPSIKVINQDNFFSSIYEKSELGLGESYMRGDWVASNNDLVIFLNVLCLNQTNQNIPKISLSNVFSSSQDYDKSNIKHHYDVGNDFYLQFLTDDLNAYSCGFWFSPEDTLNTAQYNKVNTVIKKLQAKPGSSILDIGCGWGKIANYISGVTKSKVTGITISDEQEKYAKLNYNPEQVVIINMDYRKISGQFDFIYSIGMFEHVRYENYDSFFSTIKKCLKPGGRFVLHTIITFGETNKIAKAGDNFVTTHIFPGGQIPKNDWVLNKARSNGLNVVHFEGFGGQHYARTLKAWRENMWAQKDWIRTKYPEELMLKYDYYFAVCEAGFNTGMLGIGHYIIVSEPVLSLTNSFGSITL
jgi:cyclopropane-fatty-acyl-phospholipid synthase